jgi:hypothetical protein
MPANRASKLTLKVSNRSKCFASNRRIPGFDRGFLFCRREDQSGTIWPAELKKAAEAALKLRHSLPLNTSTVLPQDSPDSTLRQIQR